MVKSNFAFSYNFSTAFFPRVVKSRDYVVQLICRLQNAFNSSNCKVLPFAKELTVSQTSFCFYASAVQVFRKHCGKRRNCS